MKRPCASDGSRRCHLPTHVDGSTREWVCCEAAAANGNSDNRFRLRFSVDAVASASNARWTPTRNKKKTRRRTPNSLSFPALQQNAATGTAAALQTLPVPVSTLKKLRGVKRSSQQCGEETTVQFVPPQFSRWRLKQHRRKERWPERSLLSERQTPRGRQMPGFPSVIIYGGQRMSAI